jgi:hypothetical protein
MVSDEPSQGLDSVEENSKVVEETFTVEEVVGSYLEDFDFEMGFKLISRAIDSLEDTMKDF